MKPETLTLENPFTRMAQRMGLSETRAAGLLGVPVHTYRKWASGQRTPSASAYRVLDLLALMETLAPDLLAALVPIDEPPKRPRGRPAGKKPAGAETPL